MKKIIKEIFELKECFVDNFKNGLLVKNKSETAFHVIDFFKGNSREDLVQIIEESQENFYEFLSEEKNFKGVIKNTNFLVVIEGDLYSKKIEKMIFDLEEDEY